MNINRSVTNENCDDRQWLACRYVLGELSPTEAEAFEQQLATDQQSRELLVVATRLVMEVHRSNVLAPHDSNEPIRRANSTLAQSSRGAQLRQWRVVGLTAAVGILVMMGVYFAPVQNRDFIGTTIPDSAESETGKLIAIWSERLSESEPVVTDRAVHASAIEVAANDEPGALDSNASNNSPGNIRVESPVDSDVLVHASDALPGWMLAAVGNGPVNGAGAGGDVWNSDGQTPEIWEN